MRRLDRQNAHVPRFYSSETTWAYREQVDEYLKNPGFSRPPALSLSRPARDQIRSALTEISFDKCSYCEDRLELNRMEIDHFRPVRGADRGNGIVERTHYCWLSMDWENLYLVCPSCNFRKGNSFPIDGTSRLSAPLSELRQTEQPRLLDPGYDDIADELAALSNGLMVARTERGQFTIELLGLNRAGLVARRAQVVRVLHQVWDACLIVSSVGQIEALLDPSADFSGFLHLYLLRHLELAGELGDLQSMSLPISFEVLRNMGALDWIGRAPYSMPISPRDNDTAKSSPRVPAIKRLSIRNFKGINQADIDFPAPSEKGAQWAAILGNNGVGKTTILQALALGLCGASRASQVVRDARSLLSPDSDRGHICVEFWYEESNNVVEFDTGSPFFSGNASVLPVVLGYGAYRILARKALSEKKRDKHCRLHTLFDEHTKINGPHGWFNRLSGKRLEDAADTIQQLLLSDQAKVELVGSKIQVSVNGRVHPIGSMSSGLQNVFSLATDILDVLYDARDSALSGQAIVLIDELDAHLHPAWRLRVVERLRAAFPMTSFFYTTHDPLTLRGIDSQEIAVLSESDGGEVSATAVNESVDGLFVDQLLTSPLFGLHTTLSEELDGQFVRYYDLLAKPDNQLSVDQKLERDELEVVLTDKGEMGTTSRERMLFKVIDKQIAASEKKRGDTQWSDQTLEMILDVLSKDESYQGLNNG